jgi:hypothetical protein
VALFAFQTYADSRNTIRRVAERPRTLDIVVGDIVEVDGRRYEVVPDDTGGVTFKPLPTSQGEAEPAESA